MPTPASTKRNLRWIKRLDGWHNISFYCEVSWYGSIWIGGLGAAGVAAQKLFGPTLSEMGSDINKLYRRGRDRILIKAANRVDNQNDGKVPNLRVARDVLWNGVLADSEVCAEYFGGILASSRTDNGVDDSSIHYVDTIKSLSSKQLHLHYCIYRSLQDHLLKDQIKINPGSESDLMALRVYFPFSRAQKVGLTIELDLPILTRNGLISAYQIENAELSDGKFLPYFFARPTTFGIALYAAALNKLNVWNNFSSTDFGNFDGIVNISCSSKSLDTLAGSLGLNLIKA